MGLTQKILLFISLLIVALAITTLGYSTYQADRLAHRTIDQALADTRGVWDTYQADRFNKLKLGVRVMANDSPFKAAVETRDETTIFDMLGERAQDLSADLFLATTPNGTLIARSDRAGQSGDDLSHDPLIARALEGEEAVSVWRQGDGLVHAVALPMSTTGELKGVLVAGYGLNESLAKQISRLTHCDVAFLNHRPGQPPRLSVSSLGPKEAALLATLNRTDLSAGGSADMAPMELDLAGDRHIVVQVPLRTVAGELVGSVVVLRSLATEMVAFKQFRNSLIVVSLVVMIAGLALAFLGARRITGPVRTLVRLVERARDGSFTGAVAVGGSDEIGVLAKAFGNLLNDLREKEQMVHFLREGMTLLRKGAVTGETSASVGTATTASIGAMATQIGVRLDKGALFAGRYEILGTLGKGGMGIVYRANDRTLDEVVALKVLRPDVLREDPSLLTRFKQEIRLARKITHRNVLRTHDFGEAEGGLPYISMEFLEGVTLKDLVVNKGALPEGVGLRIAKQMCQGLDAAHREGVVHRDIKPHNMLILPETGELKIMDFGIARLSEVKAEGGLTTEGMVMGTPDYMPPEQAQGRPADFRSDIYSLGVVFFEVFTGRLPFQGASVMDTVLKHIQATPPAPRSLNPRLHEALETVILRCLEKDPARRYQHAAEILEDLTAASSQAEAA